MDRENHLHLFSGGSRGKSGYGSPSSLVIDFGTLQRRNKRDMLGNILGYIGPAAEYLDPPLHVFYSILHLAVITIFLSTTKNRLSCHFCANCRFWTGIDSASL